ncbi:hypothetical protein AB5J52_48370 (plasmid) [Streptomyces sp. R39]|uniref:PD-(D/E)XK nuclease family protein n=1 Tax=Streptomyces sp. R39 TaxID=3238631 RepID=A0AB39R276_9ACTN
MTNTDADRPGPHRALPSTALVHIPLSAALESLPSAALATLRDALGLAVAPFTVGGELALAEKVRTIALLPAASKPDRSGPDAVVVKRVDGQLRMWLVEAKSSRHHAGRERARLGIFAALNARRAILETPTLDGWKPAVDEFARTWLGISKPDEDWLQAVSTALLGDWVDLLDEHLLDDAAGPGITLLKTESSHIHQQLQPLWRRKTGGRRLLSLDHGVAGGGRLVDLLADRTARADSSRLWEPETDRAAAVFGRLAPAEQDLAQAWAQGGRVSWPEAADLVGATEVDADHVRRKLRRLGHTHEQRLASASTTRGRAHPDSAGARG